MFTIMKKKSDICYTQGWHANVNPMVYTVNTCTCTCKLYMYMYIQYTPLDANLGYNRCVIFLFYICDPLYENLTYRAKKFFEL